MNNLIENIVITRFTIIIRSGLPNHRVIGSDIWSVVRRRLHSDPSLVSTAAASNSCSTMSWIANDASLKLEPCEDCGWDESDGNSKVDGAGQSSGTVRWQQPNKTKTKNWINFYFHPRKVSCSWPRILRTFLAEHPHSSCPPFFLCIGNVFRVDGSAANASTT